MKIATIQRITNVMPVENSDNLDVVDVLGWKVVVRRGEFQVNDLCIYVGLDSIMPEKPEFEFMRRSHFIVKTIKLRGQISQGLVFPLSIIENLNIILGDYSGDLENLDVTDILRVTKYEKEIDAKIMGKQAGKFPSYIISKTDEERIQNHKALLDEMRGLECYSSVKVDGTSGTFLKNDEKTFVCSRNNAMQDDGENVYSYIFRKYALDKVFEKYPNVAIQGEIAGPKIQKNRLKLKEPTLFIFNLYDINTRRFFNLSDFLSFCNDNMLTHVEIDKYFIMNHSLEELLEMAKGNYTSGYPREGIVIRPLIERYSSVLKGRMSVKVINNDYTD
jgi:RNA ligase (TIGR02306 family)